MIDAPASPPGGLGTAAPPREVLAYLGVLTRWRDDVHDALEQLDERARASTNPDGFVADVTLAFALWQSVTTRIDEVVATWDSGRVGDKELETISELLWGRLDDNLDAAVPVTFTEACTLLEAIVRRLTARLDADALARPGVGDVLGALREQLDRARVLALQLGARGDDVAALIRRLGEAEAEARRGTDVADRLAAIARDLAPLAGDLAAADTAGRRLAAAADLEAEVRVLGRRCADKIAGAPRLAVPAVAALGPVPAIDDRAALDAFVGRLDQVERALAEARRRFAEPLDHRAELRGLLDAYQQMAARRGRAEDAALGQVHAAAKAVLWSAPCDLVEGRRLLERYRRAVHEEGT